MTLESVFSTYLILWILTRTLSLSGVALITLPWWTRLVKSTTSYTTLNTHENIHSNSHLCKTHLFCSLLGCTPGGRPGGRSWSVCPPLVPWMPGGQHSASEGLCHSSERFWWETAARACHSIHWCRGSPGRHSGRIHRMDGAGCGWQEGRMWDRTLVHRLHCPPGPQGRPGWWRCRMGQTLAWAGSQWCTQYRPCKWNVYIYTSDMKYDIWLTLWPGHWRVGWQGGWGRSSG